MVIILVITDPKSSESFSSLKAVWRILSKLLLVDILALIPVSLLFTKLDYSVIISLENFYKVINTLGFLAIITGFGFLLLFAMTSQRVSSLGRTTSEWGRASKGPTTYSEEIIQRQMKDWPRVIAGFINMFLGILLIGIILRIQ